MLEENLQHLPAFKCVNTNYGSVPYLKIPIPVACSKRPENQSNYPKKQDYKKWLTRIMCKAS